MSTQDDEYQRGLIITDDIAIEPILDFNLYTSAIVKIIKESYPKFTIGLFGDWGTGKTTLMNSVYRILQKDNNSILVKFETWRYEREEQFALIPLLKTIAFALPDTSQFQSLKQKLKRGAINLFKKSPEIASSIISRYLGEHAEKITEEVIESFRKEFNSKLELLAEVDRDTLYFDGFEDIRNEIQKIRRNNPAFRIVVFVDDLDRCSPRKTLEVLESIKVFLGMEGFIYVIGLSHDVVTKLIDIEYKETGVKGEEYIKKMIQIPITLPKWDNKDITKLIQDFIDKNLIHEDYKYTVDRDLISTAVENNPREVKRFLNNFIIAYEIFHSIENFKATELLLIQAIQLRWNEFYDLLMRTDRTFRKELDKYAQMDDDKRLKTLDSQELDEEGLVPVTTVEDPKYILRFRKLLSNYKTNIELWTFLRNYSNTLSNIIDITIYRRSVEVGIEPTTRATDKNQEAYTLLKGGDITTFNERITEFRDLDLRGALLEGADLRMANLKTADLRQANLEGALLEGALLEEADLRRADLRRADLRKVNLRAANLGEANLVGANLRAANLGEANLGEADLRRADLRAAYPIGAYLIGTNLEGTNLEGADLSKSLIIGSAFKGLRLNGNTTFYSAIIADPEFVNYIRRFTKNVPEKIVNKNELRRKLLEIKSDERIITNILSTSRLPE